MAEFSIVISIPDDKEQALLDAINWNEGGRSETPLGMSKAQVCKKFKRQLIGKFEQIYADHQIYLVAQENPPDALGAE